MPTVLNAPTKMQACIDVCNGCMQACEECLSLCLQEADVKARVHCINMLRDCADICAMAAQYMSRGSHHAKQLCSLCATICEACANDCAQFKDQHCLKCADACKICATECRKMAQ